MDKKTEERIKALEIALNNEAFERDFYLKHKERTTNPLGKLMFGTIASDESEHYQRILKLHEKLKEEGKWPDTIPLKVKGTEVKSVLQNVIDSVETLPEADKDDMEAVKIAVDFEAKGVKFYEKLRDSVDDPLEKEFYGMLASIEREHLLSLQDTYEYFQDPEGWYRIKEKHHFDGA
ncbi:MAG: ferritin family protein [Deltaproteobacteria bacterium]|jgi:rubrerythrin|nr:ferritin family protein [Deltaproteobacteria bacterium]